MKNQRGEIKYISPLSYKFDDHSNHPQYIEDLSCACWVSQILFSAIDLEIFTLVSKGNNSSSALSQLTNTDRNSLDRFLNTLCSLGLLYKEGKNFYNSLISDKHLVKGKDSYLGNSIKNRSYIFKKWQGLTNCLRKGQADLEEGFERDEKLYKARMRRYILAMHDIARYKSPEIANIVLSLKSSGKIIDIGCGSGAVGVEFLKRSPSFSSLTLFDLPEVIKITKELTSRNCLNETKIRYICGNILDHKFDVTNYYDIVILSNIIHAYSECEADIILRKSYKILKENGIIVIHDYLLSEEKTYPVKAALYDLNMFLNTYCGRVFSLNELQKIAGRTQLYLSRRIDLETDTSIILASKSPLDLSFIDKKGVLQLLTNMPGIKGCKPISTSDIVFSEWVEAKCRFGCPYYAKKLTCPPFINCEKVKKLIMEYNYAIIVEGEPPSKNFHETMLKIERKAFISGYYKALVLVEGPCPLCNTCPENKICRFPEKSRPSMEACGIDVFETVRRAGFNLKVLEKRNEYVKYFGLLLLT